MYLVTWTEYTQGNEYYSETFSCSQLAYSHYQKVLKDPSTIQAILSNIITSTKPQLIEG